VGDRVEQTRLGEVAHAERDVGRLAEREGDVIGGLPPQI